MQWIIARQTLEIDDASRYVEGFFDAHVISIAIG